MRRLLINFPSAGVGTQPLKLRFRNCFASGFSSPLTGHEIFDKLVNASSLSVFIYKIKSGNHCFARQSFLICAFSTEGVSVHLLGPFTLGSSSGIGFTGFCTYWGVGKLRKQRQLWELKVIYEESTAFSFVWDLIVVQWESASITTYCSCTFIRFLDNMLFLVSLLTLSYLSVNCLSPGILTLQRFIYQLKLGAVWQLPKFPSSTWTLYTFYILQNISHIVLPF